jgi:rubrerythrin
MIAQLTLENVLKKAIEKEIESQRLYRDLSQKMKDEAVSNLSKRQEAGQCIILSAR